MSLLAEEREVILRYCDADHTWHLHCDSKTYRGRLKKWVESLKIPLESVEFGFQAEGIPRWAVGFRAKRGKGGRGNSQNLKKLTWVEARWQKRGTWETPRAVPDRLTLPGVWKALEATFSGSHHSRLVGRLPSASPMCVRSSRQEGCQETPIRPVPHRRTPSTS